MSMLQLEIPDDQMSGLKKCAEEKNLSVERFAVDALEGVIKARKEWDRMEALAKEANWEEFQRIMAKVPDVPPMPGDELPEGWKPNKH